MKSLHLYLIAMAAALTACSSDEAIAPAAGGDVDNEMCFSTVVADVTSRGTNVDLASLQSTGFWVKALKVDGTSLWRNTDTGDMLHFAYNSTSGTFKPEAIDGKTFNTTWPAGQTIWLYATNIDPTGTDGIKMSKQNASGEAAYNGMIYDNLPMNTDVTKQFDFVYASNYGRSSDFSGGAVPLYFRHAFCQVEIQAKNSNPAYTVKVKGYKLNYANIAGKFWFLDAEQYTTADALAAAMKAQDDAATAEAITAAGSNLVEQKKIVTYAQRHWSFNPVNGFVNYESGYKNGFTTTASGIYDDDEANHITLTSEAQTIGNGTENNKMMIIPWGNYSGYDLAATNTGPYIALLVQIDFKEGETDGSYGQHRTPLYPACRVPATATANNLSTRVSYTGLPKYYGWIYVPYTFNADWKYYIGKKVTFVLDFTNGLGKVDMNKPLPVDATATGYDATTGTTTGTALTAADDPYTAKSDVMGKDIIVTATVTDWDPATGYNPKTLP